MRSIHLASVTPFVGKNVVCLGLALKLMEMGRKVGYFKPFGPLVTEHEGIITDSDAVFFRKALGLEDAFEDICPVVVTDEVVADVLRGADFKPRDRIFAAFRRVSEGKDVVLCVGMGRLSSGLTAEFPASEFVRIVRGKAIMLDRYRYPFETLDGILHARTVLGDCLAGVVFNRVQETAYSQVTTAVKSFLESREIDVFGVLPEDPILGAVPIRDIVHAVGGHVLCGSSELERMVEGFNIGAMNVDAAVRYFRRTPQRAVVTGGDRSDVQLAALESGAKCLILTGDLYPNERILTRAEELKVPVIEVSKDTSATIAACEQLASQLTLTSDKKIDRAREICRQYLDFDRLFSKTGILG